MSTIDYFEEMLDFEDSSSVRDRLHSLLAEDPGFDSAPDDLEAGSPDPWDLDRLLEELAR